MKKLILASTAAVAMLGLAACSDTDETTTQSIEDPATSTAPMEPADDAAVAPDSADEPVETESVAPEAPEANQ